MPQTQHHNEAATIQNTCINISTKHLLYTIHVTELPIYCSKHDQFSSNYISHTNSVYNLSQTKWRSEHRYLNQQTASESSARGESSKITPSLNIHRPFLQISITNNLAVLLLYRIMIWGYKHSQRNKLQQNQQYMIPNQNHLLQFSSTIILSHLPHSQNDVKANSVFTKFKHTKR